MVDEWRRQFRDHGEVEVYVSRRIGGLGMLAGAVGFGAAALYLLLIPATGRLPAGVLRFGGVVGLLLALPALAYAVRMLVRPMLLLRLDREGLATTHAPLARWEEVEGARTRHSQGLALAEVLLADGYWQRMEAEDPTVARRLRAHAVGGRADTVVVPSGAPGGGDALVRLILWARQEVESAR
jgi:hypothetical protein